MAIPMIGANVAWIHYGADFGTDIPNSTFATFETYAKAISANRGNTLRFWIHCIGTTTPQWSADGHVVATDPRHRLPHDLRRYLDLAHTHRIRLLFSLFNFGIQHHHRPLLDDGPVWDSYVDHALTPMVEATRNHPALAAWEIINEPEGMTRDIPGAGWDPPLVDVATLQGFVNRAAAALHALDAHAVVTVGAWSMQSMHLYADAALRAAGSKHTGTLDLYQAHWYAHSVGTGMPDVFAHDAAFYNLDKPLLIGEFSQSGAQGMYTIETMYAHAVQRGYAGALGWQANGGGANADPLALLCKGIRAATVPTIHVTGRYALVQGAIVFSWSAVTLQIRGVFSSLAVQWADTTENTYFHVEVDGKPMPRLQSARHRRTTTLVSDAAWDMHVVVVRKVTEPLYGVTTVFGLVVDDNVVAWEDCHVVYAGKDPTVRRIEFLGDSVVAGYGNLGHAPCHATGALESIDMAYPVLVANAFRAQVFVEAWSGIGVVRNYGTPNRTSAHTFKDVWPEAVDHIPWNFAWRPDVVVIHIGGNDYSTQPHPVNTTFAKEYYQLLESVWTAYGVVQLFHVCGPMPDDPCDLIRQQMALFREAHGPVAHVIEAQGIMQCPQQCGCDGHPDAGMHARLAALVEAAVGKVMGW